MYDLFKYATTAKEISFCNSGQLKGTNKLIKSIPEVHLKLFLIAGGMRSFVLP